MSITPKSLAATAIPDAEVTLKPVRRTYTAAYKQAILQESEQCALGEIGAILRREGLYSSHLAKWRSQRARGELAGLEPQARGSRPEPQQALVAQLGKKVIMVSRQPSQRRTFAIKVSSAGRGPKVVSSLRIRPAYYSQSSSIAFPCLSIGHIPDTFRQESEIYVQFNKTCFQF